MKQESSYLGNVDRERYHYVGTDGLHRRWEFDGDGLYRIIRGPRENTVVRDAIQEAGAKITYSGANVFITQCSLYRYLNRYIECTSGRSPHLPIYGYLVI